MDAQPQFFSQCNPERVGKVGHYNIDELENEWFNNMTFKMRQY